MCWGHVNGFSTSPEQLLDHVRLSSPTAKRFIAQHQLGIDHHRRLRNEEPFALTTKGPVLPAIPFIGGDLVAGQCLTNRRRLQRIHGLTDRGCTTGHGGNEPFALIMTAEETVQLRLVTRLANEQQQVPLLGLALHDGDIERLAQVRGNAEFEELAFAVTLDIEGIIVRTDPRAISLGPAGRNLTHFDPSAHLGKPRFNRFRIHMYYSFHSTRYPAGLSSWEKITERVWLGRVGRSCRFFLFTITGFRGAG